MLAALEVSVHVKTCMVHWPSGPHAVKSNAGATYVPPTSLTFKLEALPAVFALFCPQSVFSRPRFPHTRSVKVSPLLNGPVIVPDVICQFVS